ncbi:hypothetical protein O6H91_Y111900 [Diphasiastrum complanatum]|nr:hypothetical protein O6H91_Y111900 [Diphasiastrum complanatum]
MSWLMCKNREGANLNSDRDLHRYSRTQFSSPITSPRGFSQSCHQHSPNFSPYHSPYRSSCPSPLASPSPVGSPTPMPQCPRKWQRGQELGRGSFGTVYEGWNLEDGSFFAVKISSDENFSLEVQQEVAVLSRLHHPNIVRYLGTSVGGWLSMYFS